MKAADVMNSPIVAATPNGRIAGVAPNCLLYAIKVLTGSHSGGPSGRISWVLAGMNWAAEHGLDVLGVEATGSVMIANQPCPFFLQRMGERLARRGCLAVCAAGNTGQTARPWVQTPARCPEYLSVGAVDRNKAVAPFSSRGPEGMPIESAVELVAPGVAVTSTYLQGGYQTWSGTGSAFPHVIGWCLPHLRRNDRRGGALLGSKLQWPTCHWRYRVAALADGRRARPSGPGPISAHL